MSLPGLALRDLPATVPSILRWNASADVHHQVWRHHLELLTERWSDALTAFVNAHIGLRLASLADELTAEGLNRLLLAPETGRRLLHGPATDLVFFLESVCAELCRANPRRVVAEPVWTALGDAYFPTGVHRSSESTSRWDAEQPFEAPRLLEHVPVDCVSPFAARATGLVGFPFVEMPAEEIRAAIRKLVLALEAIAEVCGPAVDMLRASTRVVIIRKDPGAPTMFSSFSADQLVGRLALVNVQSATCDAALAADALIHEAIHSCVYAMEECVPLVKDRLAAELETVISPWSGRALPVHTFFHACLVWFGLSHFWRLALDAGAFPRARVQRLLGRSRRGFHEPGFDVAMTTALHHLSPEWHCIVGLVAEAREMEL